MTMTDTEYERQRQLNISKNRELLSGLSLGNRRAKDVSTKSTHASRRQKLEPLPPTRASARLSSIPRPSYKEEDGIKELSRPAPKKAAAATKSRRLNDGDIAEIVARWRWQPSSALPTRDDYGTLHFDDYPDFLPNLTPEEILRQGAFGGSYYRPVYSKTLSMIVYPDYSDLPPEWFTDLVHEEYLTSPTPNASINKYRVLCGQSIEEWEASGWIDYNYDPRGWFQWYSRFYLGRRCDDDERQVGRWKRCVGPTGRWKRILLKRYKEKGIRDADGDDAEEVSPVVHQTCHHWAYHITQEDLDQAWESWRIS